MHTPSSRTLLAPALWLPLLLLLATLLPTPACHAKLQHGDSGTWTKIHQQTQLAAGTSTQPSVRYGHAMSVYRGDILMTHGYYFDREANNATWMSDTWSMQGMPPHRWSRLLPGIDQDSANKAYVAGKTPAAPCGRFGHATAVVGTYLYLYGGHDGGMSRHGRQNYEPGYDFDEMWRLDLARKQWHFLPARGSELSPGKRYLFAMAAVRDQIILYGGMAEGNGDVWAFDTKKESWTRLADEYLHVNGGPGRRVGHALVPVDVPGGPAGVLLYGGRWVEDGQTRLEGDVWFFDLGEQAWRRLFNSSEPPPGRKYHAMMATNLPLGGGATMPVAVVAGGTITTPALTCSHDAWAITYDCAVQRVAWQRLPNLNEGVYDLRGAADGATAFVYGGHLCTSTKGDNPYYYVNTAERLDLHAHRPAYGCKVAPGGKARTVAAPAEFEL